jgi:hypothetical protein
LNFSLFNIDIGAFEMQLLELKTKNYGAPNLNALMLIWKNWRKINVILVHSNSGLL